MAYQMFGGTRNGLRDSHLEYNPTTGQMERAVLLEGYARTFLQFSDTSQNAGFLVVTTGVAGAPDGTATVIQAVEDTNNAYHRIQWLTNASVSSYTQSFAVCVKAFGRTKCFVNGGSVNDGGKTPAIVNLLTGAVEVPYSDGRTLRVTAVSNGWWLIETTWLYTGTEGFISIGCVNASGATSYLGDGVSGLLFWRPTCFTNQAFPSSLIFSNANFAGYASPTPLNSENSYGTGRYPDLSLDLDGSGIASGVPLCGMLEFIEKGSSKVTNAGLFYLGRYDNTLARLYLQTGSTGYQLVHNNGTSSVSSVLGSFPAMYSLVRLRWQLNADGSVQVWQSVNNKAEVAATQSAALALASWGDTRVFMNGIGRSNPGFIAVRKAFVMEGARTLADFIALG